MTKKNVRPGFHPKFNHTRYANDEQEIIYNLSREWYVTSSGNTIRLAASKYNYFLMKPTNIFSEMFNIESLGGRTFSEERGTGIGTPPTEENPFTEATFVVNKLAARQLGWTAEEAIGKWFEVSSHATIEHHALGDVALLHDIQRVADHIEAFFVTAFDGFLRHVVIAGEN